MCSISSGEDVARISITRYVEVGSKILLDNAVLLLDAYQLRWVINLLNLVD